MKENKRMFTIEIEAHGCLEEAPFVMKIRAAKINKGFEEKALMFEEIVKQAMLEKLKLKNIAGMGLNSTTIH